MNNGYFKKINSYPRNVPKKSTVKNKKSPGTRTNTTSLIKNPKKINIDQL